MDPPTIYNIFLLSEPKISKKLKFLSFWIFEVDLSWSSVHARARWNLKFDVISGGSSIKIENWMSGQPFFVIFILWTFSLGPRWTFDNTYVSAILNLGTFQPLIVNICSKSQKFGNRSSVHARARWNLIWYDFRWLWIKIENWTSGHTDFLISILWTFTLVLRWTFDNTYMNAILNLGTCQPLWTFAVTFRNLEIDPACTRVHAGISFDTISGGCE